MLLPGWHILCTLSLLLRPAQRESIRDLLCKLVIHLVAHSSCNSLCNFCNVMYGVPSLQLQQSQELQGSLGLLLGLLRLQLLQQQDTIYQVLGSCRSCPLTLQLLYNLMYSRGWQLVPGVSCRKVVTLTVDVWYSLAGVAG